MIDINLQIYCSCTRDNNPPFRYMTSYIFVILQPPNDEFQISREDLIRGLRGCLSACPEFGPLCVPLLLDKLQSDVQSAILDSLLTLVNLNFIFFLSQKAIFIFFKNKIHVF